MYIVLYNNIPVSIGPFVSAEEAWNGAKERQTLYCHANLSNYRVARVTPLTRVQTVVVTFEERS